MELGGVKRGRVDGGGGGGKKPKRPMTAFFLFLAEVRGTIERENPNLRLTERAKILGEMWRDLPKGEKEAYQRVANINEERYTQDMAMYEQEEKAAKKLRPN